MVGFQAVADAHRFIATHLDGSVTRFWYRLSTRDAPPFRAIASTYLWAWVLVNEDMPRLTTDQAATPGADATATVRAMPDELAKSRALINKFERDPNAACRLAETRIRQTIESVDRAMEAATGRDVTPSPDPQGLKGPGLLGPGGRLVGGPDMAIAQVRDDEPCHAGEPTETQLDSPAMSWRMCLISSVARAS